MRRNSQNQLSFAPKGVDHRGAKELETISAVLDANPTVARLAAQDLTHGDRERGAPGMSGDQVVRAAVLKQLAGLTYRVLAFYLDDSVTFRL